MTDVKKILFEVCEDERVFDSNFDLIESGVLDSLAFIELFSRLEDYGIEIYPTRVDRKLLRTPGLIEKLVEEYDTRVTI